jgi:hypothetical protein
MNNITKSLEQKGSPTQKLRLILGISTLRKRGRGFMRGIAYLVTPKMVKYIMMKFT